jgi:hypothetical protein
MPPIASPLATEPVNSPEPASSQAAPPTPDRLVLIAFLIAVVVFGSILLLDLLSNLLR